MGPPIHLANKMGPPINPGEHTGKLWVAPPYAMEWLCRAEAAGVRNPAAYRNEKALDSLRDGEISRHS